MTDKGFVANRGARENASFKVTRTQVFPNGIISVSYERDGDVKTGAPQIEEND